MAQDVGAGVAGGDVRSAAVDRDHRLRRAEQRGGAAQLGGEIRLPVAAHQAADLGEGGAGDLRDLPPVLHGPRILPLGQLGHQLGLHRDHREVAPGDVVQVPGEAQPLLGHGQSGLRLAGDVELAHHRGEPQRQAHHQHRREDQGRTGAGRPGRAAEQHDEHADEQRPREPELPPPPHGDQRDQQRHRDQQHPRLGAAGHRRTDHERGHGSEQQGEVRGEHAHAGQVPAVPRAAHALRGPGPHRAPPGPGADGDLDEEQRGERRMPGELLAEPELEEDADAQRQHHQHHEDGPRRVGVEHAPLAACARVHVSPPDRSKGA